MGSGSRIYDGNQAGNADIYLQSIGGYNAINLTKDSPEDDTQPAFRRIGDSIVLPLGTRAAASSS